MRQKNTPNDPQRRERIITATMALLAEAGVGAVTARAVARRLDIPVGSVSYHFDSVRALLLEASRRVIALRAQDLEQWRADVTAENVTDRLAELIHHQMTTGRQLTIVAYELYILGLRDEDFRAISSRSIPLLRDALSDFVPSLDATRLAATADGFQLESLFDQPPPTLHATRAALRSTETE
jgi:TetR/AcrR family transcriptional regulator, regulator of biofilm formation and stress response